MERRSLNEIISEIYTQKNTSTIISRDDFLILESLYIECIAMLTNEILKFDLNNKLTSKKKLWEQKLLNIIDDALLFIEALINKNPTISDSSCDSRINCSNIPKDSHFLIYLVKAKADFLKCKSKLNCKLIFQSRETYKYALSLLTNHSFACPYKVDVFFGLYICNTLIYKDQRSISELKDLYVQTKYQLDFINPKYYDYFSKLLRYVNIFLSRNNKVYECTLRALVRNNYTAKMILIVTEEEFLRTFYFL